jgi:hypothetical protein
MIEYMNAIIKLDSYNVNSVNFSEYVKNRVLDGEFARIIYATKYYCINGIRIHIPNHFYNIDPNTHGNILSTYITFTNHAINILQKIERDIIEKMNLYGSEMMQFNLHDRIASNCPIKLCRNSTAFSSIILSISGVWKTPFTYGITYKFIPVCDNIPTPNNL